MAVPQSKSKDPDEEGRVRKYREEVVEVIFKHIDECEALERRRPGAGGSDRNTANRGKLFANATGLMSGGGSSGAGASSGSGAGSSSGGNRGSSPFDDGNDADLDQQLALIQKKNDQIVRDI